MKKKSTLKLLTLFLIVSCLLVSSMYSFISAKEDDDTKIFYFSADNKQEFVISNEPAKDWDPTLASDDELKHYGIPERPADKESLKQWESMVKGKMYIKPSFTPIKSSSHKVKFNTYANTQNWSGYVKKCKTGYTLKSVLGTWTVKTASATLGNRPADSAPWVGLGGYAPLNSALAQAGTVSNVTSGGTSEYYTWFEVIGTNLDESAYKLDNMATSPNDSITINVFVSYVSSTDLTNINYYIVNNTTNTYTSFSKVASGNYTGQNQLGSSAEWILERPELNLTNFGSVLFSNCKYSYLASAEYYLADDNSSPSTVESITMKNSLSTTLAYPTSLSSNGTFTVYWSTYK